MSLSKGTNSNEINSAINLNENCLKKEDENCLTYWAVKILNTPEPSKKCELTNYVAAKWANNELNCIGDFEPPDQPQRLPDLNVIDAGKIRRGKGGTAASRIALLHSLANIEQWAIDLSWDIIARFSTLRYPDQTQLPKEFFTDFIKVACDEAKVNLFKLKFYNLIFVKLAYNFRR